MADNEGPSETGQARVVTGHAAASARRTGTSAASRCAIGAQPGAIRGVVLALLCCLLAACLGGDRSDRAELAGSTMGTTWSVQVTASGTLDLVQLDRELRAELEQIERAMSTWRADSVISHYNRAPAGSWHALPLSFEQVLTAALELAEATGGAFDPTIGPLVDLWGFGPEGERLAPPTQAQIDATRERIGWQRLRRDSDGRLLQPGNLHLDLSAIAKGHGVDRLAALLDRHGAMDYLVEIGGELRARGQRPGGGSWRVGLEMPAEDASAIDRGLLLSDRAVATSGSYRNRFRHDGRNYSHLIDPRTGEPVHHGLVAVTVVHSECMWADALATALLVMGPEAGLAHAQRHGLNVRMIEVQGKQMREHATPGFQALLSQP